MKGAYFAVRSKTIFSKKSLSRFVLPLLLLGVSVVILFTYKDYGVTWDEAENIALGNHALQFYTSFGRNTSYFSFIKLAYKTQIISTRGPFVEVIRAIIFQLSKQNSLAFYHLVLALFALTTFFFMFKITQLLTKDTRIAALSLLLLFFMPRFYGDIFTNSKDIAPVYLLLGVIYFSLISLSGKQSVKHLILLGIFFGLLTTIRSIFLLYVYVLFLSISFIKTVLQERQQVKRFAREQGITFLFFIATVYITQPYLLLHPLSGIKAMIDASTSYPHVIGVLFLGRQIASNHLPWSYLPVWMTITIPVMTLFFFIIGNIYTLVLLFKQTDSLKYSAGYIFLIFWLPVIYIVFRHPDMYDAWRFVLFLTGPLVILASLGFVVLVTSKYTVVRLIIVLLFIANIILIGSEMIRLHPYEYVYFNSLVGGLRGAYGTFETDYWGASFKEATEWIDAHRYQLQSADGIVHVDSCMLPLTKPYLVEGVALDHPSGNIYVCFTRFNGDRKYQGDVLYEVKRDGVPLSIVKLKN